MVSLYKREEGGITMILAQKPTKAREAERLLPGTEE
jgi:hypothetical protein